MKRIICCVAVCALLFALCLSVGAQQSKGIPRIGFLPSSGDANDPGPQVKVFQQGLRDLGYVEGKNILIGIDTLRGRLTVSRASSPTSCN